MATDLETRLAKAKAALILEHPFWGTLAMNMKTIITDEVPTAATDGKRVLFNPDFMGGMSDEELKFIVAHEIGHPMFDHLTRRGARDARKWNMAADYVINRLLIEEGIGKMPDGGLDNASLHAAGEGVTDKIYKLLPEDGGGGGGGNGGGGGDQPGDFTLAGDMLEQDQSDGDKSQTENEWRVKVSQAAQAAKMMGKLSAGVERLIGELLQSRVDWREVLQQFIVKLKAEDRTWSRANRTMAANGAYLPGRTGETMGDLVFAFDCSGSISFGDDGEGTQFAAEIMTVKEDHNPRNIHVVYFDSRVCHHDAFSRDEELHFAPHGGGGTAFSPVFQFLSENDITPEACIFLTDLYCNDFGEQPEYPVLWVTTAAENAPFGEVVKMAPG
jgi:predicted metal-dependent peptidase